MAQLAAMAPSGAMAREASIFLDHALAMGKKQQLSSASFPPKRGHRKTGSKGNEKIRALSSDVLLFSRKA